MNRPTLFFISLILIFASVESTATINDKVSIERLFSIYMEKYNHYISTGKLVLEPTLYRQQVLVTSDGNAPTLVPEDKLYGQVRIFLDSLKQRGVTKVQWDKVDIHIIGKNMALASNIAIRFDEQGKVIDRVGASYNLYRENNEWKIAAFAIHSPDTTYRFDSPSAD